MIEAVGPFAEGWAHSNLILAVRVKDSHLIYNANEEHLRIFGLLTQEQHEDQLAKLKARIQELESPTPKLRKRNAK